MKKPSIRNFTTCITLVALIYFSHQSNGQTVYEHNLVKSKADSIFSECEGQPGCAVGVMHDNELIYQSGYGFSNMDHKTPTNPETVFEIGTLSMHFTAAGIMMLEHEGKLSLDDEVQKYLPEIPQYKEGKITLRNMLTHSSGLRDYIVLLMAAGKPLDTSLNNAEALLSLNKQQALSMVPGSSYRFSQSNYTLLAIIIERITKQSFPEYLRKNIFQPAGMTYSLVYDNPNRVIPNRAFAYNGQAANYTRVLSDRFLANGSSRIFTSISDFTKWNRFLNEKQLGNESLLSKLSQVSHLNNGREMTYRFGLDGGLFIGHEMVAHNGYGFGFNAMYLHFPEEKLSIVAMNSNGNISAPGKAYDLAEAILPAPQNTGGTTSRAEREIITLDAKKLEKFTGDYFDSKYAYTRKILVSDDTMRLQINPNAIRTLVPVSETEFMIHNSPADVSIKFDQSAESTQMSVTINDGEPATYQSFTQANYTSQDLVQFGGEFVSEELGVTYRIQHEGMTISTHVGDMQLVSYTHIMDDNFTSDHDGYITFQRNKKGKITGFVLSDYSLGSISFIKS